MGYLKDTLKGITWMTALEAITKGVAIGKIAILARILSPSQFGSYGIALLVLGLLETLTETGINIFLIQEKDDADNYLDSAWVVSIIRGVLIAMLIVLSIPWILKFFNTPHVGNLLYLVAGVALIRGFINPMEVFFQKKLEFMKVFMFQGVLYLTDAAAAVTLGILTHSESAMIISMIVAATLEVVLSFVLFQARPKIKFEKEKFLRVVHSGKWVTGAGIFSYIFQNIDNVVVGKFLGTTNLGFYQQSYSISTLPVSGVNDIFNKVMFPVFVKMSNRIIELKYAFYKALGAIFSFALIFGTIIFFFSSPIILIFLGPKWLVIEPVLKILAIFGVFKAILNTTYSLFLSLKMQKAIMLSELFGIIGMAIAIYPMVMKYGIVGAGYSTIIAVLCSFPVVIFNVQKIFHSK
ncbi:MAG TPA: oligosaccharide flippase family protein [Patescibacteria group bacterium]|nr:oligosaccharide flippase family protein [Patescibacteria group bacterium]